MQDNPTTRRINATLPTSVYEVLESIAERRGVSITEVLRDAVALEKWADDAMRDGARLLIERNGEVREVVLR